MCEHAAVYDVWIYTDAIIDNIGGIHDRIQMQPVHLEVVLHHMGWPTILLRDKRSTPIVQCSMLCGTISKPFSDFDLVDQNHDMHAF